MPVFVFKYQPLMQVKNAIPTDFYGMGAQKQHQMKEVMESFYSAVNGRELEEALKLGECTRKRGGTEQTNKYPVSYIPAKIGHSP